ncbi:MAG: OsmC family protein [Victivallaceae bacterium]|nr:OsmC family protein [Victivallaceae bacterium]
MITAVNGPENYRIELDNGSKTIVSDVSADKGGSGDGFRPHELLAAAYASCLNISIRMIMNRLKMPYSNVRVEVDIDRGTVGKTLFLSRVRIDGDISEDDRRKILALASNCPVRKTLSQKIEFAALS